MHILVTNDDGPPSTHASPYVASLVAALHKAGHTTQIVVPHTQCSWIGKSINAHGIVTARPAFFPEDIFDKEAKQGTGEWILVEGTPATCTQLGLGYYQKGTDRGEGFDLVVSGPNYGRNSTAVFAMSSGTLGGALEGAVCGKKSIALSYAFFGPEHNPTHIHEASAASVRVIEHLYKNWDSTTQVYTINVPLGSPSLSQLGGSPVRFVPILDNIWSNKPSFAELPRDTARTKTAAEREMELRDAEEQAETGMGSGLKKVNSSTDEGVRKFQWRPDFDGVHASVESAGDGNDGWVVSKGGISVSALRANFMHAEGGGGVDFSV